MKAIKIKVMRSDMEVLIPLNSIFKVLKDTNSELLNGPWQVQCTDMGLGRADFMINGSNIKQGVNTFDNGIDFFGLLSQEISFDHGYFKRCDDKVTIGIHDSDFIYVIADEKIIDSVAEHFPSTDMPVPTTIR